MADPVALRWGLVGGGGEGGRMRAYLHTGRIQIRWGR